MCKRSGYSADKVVIGDPNVASEYLKKLKSVPVYKYAESYARVGQHTQCTYSSVCTVYHHSFTQCRDTYWIESFNHALLTYLPKRVHFGKATFEARMDLAVLDWVS